jgi:hypothetical protein
VSGGVLCVAGVAVAVVALPAFWRYRSTSSLPSDDEPAGVGQATPDLPRVP